MDYIGKGEVLTNTDLNKFVCIEKVLDLLFKLMKNESKNKSAASINHAYIKHPNRPLCTSKVIGVCISASF